jgi:putative DNA methylase
MTSGLPKRLIEVDLPIKRISEHARREKSIRHGHISTLHIWWARRPLAACRAVLCAALWLDPADPECPDAFRQAVRIEMSRWVKDNLRLLSNESLQRFIGFQKNPSKLDDNKELRAALLDFIADFANWDNSTIKEFLDTSRTLTLSAHEALGGASGTKPLVVDPFAGGGAIPLEALRVGADVFANDLNPIPILLNKVVLEYIPKYGTHLADEVHKWGEWIKREAKKELTEFYPEETDGAAPIAYLWARTIRCEGPNCGSEVPLIRSLWLKKNNPAVAFKIVPQPMQKRVCLEVIENAKPADVKEGTVKRSSATCPCCGYTTPADRVRTQFLGRKGGASDARLLAVVTSRLGVSGRSYRVATENDMEIVEIALSPANNYPICEASLTSTCSVLLSGRNCSRHANCLL